MKPKRLLLTALIAFTFIGATGCSKEKKVSAEEAKTVMESAATNTESKLENCATVSFKNSVKGNISANDIKASSIALVDKVKATVNSETNTTIAYNKNERKAKIATNGTSKVDGTLTSTFLKNMTGWDSPKKLNYSVKDNAEAYYIAGNNKANIYTNYNVDLNDQLVNDFKLDTKTYVGKYNLKTILYGDLFDDDEESDTSNDTSTNFDFIKDWNIFKKKGNVYIADCSNLEAFDLGEDFNEKNAKLKEIGLEFKVSKLQFELNSDKTFKNFDFTLTLGGKADLSKMTGLKEKRDMLAAYASLYKPEFAAKIKLIPLDNLVGLADINLDFNNRIDFDYSNVTISVPSDLSNLPETDLDELISIPFRGNSNNSENTTE